MRVLLSVFLSLWVAVCQVNDARADSISDNPIVFVTAIPNWYGFGALFSTFGNQLGGPDVANRGGDLWIRYADGSLKNLTSAAGYGNTGFQGASSIAVRDPSVHWNGTKVIFSMIVGNPTQQYQLTNFKWQLYEITNLGSNQTPVITKVSNQPANFNNIMPIYASDDSIIFVSDHPRDESVINIYPQKDEYESAATNTGLWKLSPGSGLLELLDHAPSGDFNPIIDSYGRVIFTRWDHLQRDQQNVGASLNAFNFASEASNDSIGSAAEVFPEARDTDDPDYRSDVNLFTINQFFPWMMNQDGTEMETLNHIGRQEVGLYSERSFNNDPNIEEFYGQYDVGLNENDFEIFLHIRESPTAPGNYFGTSCQEFGTHAAGQIISMNGAPGVNPDNMIVTYHTHPDTSGATNSPSVNHSGLYRDPLPLANGKMIAAHTANTREDANIGTSNSPLSRYDFRIKLVTKSGSYFTPSTLLTPGISKSVSFWDPDKMVSYNGTLWELQPVELKARIRPDATVTELPAEEQGLLDAAGVTLEELKEYLRLSNLALIIGRNLTSRDRNDRQQPTNLRVNGTSTESIPNSGKIYNISNLQIFQGDLVRGYGNPSSTNGRRVLAQPLHSVADGINIPVDGAPTGSIEIAADGSMAAFVPARKALTWHTISPEQESVVRERYWLTFQPGEVRVCKSCHGVNTADHLGNSGPTNAPLAFARLLAHFKDLPLPNPTPGGNYKLKIKGMPRVRPGGKFRVRAQGGSSSDSLVLTAKIKKAQCVETAEFPVNSGTDRSLSGKFPISPRAKVTFTLKRKNGTTNLASKSVTLPDEGLSGAAKAPAKACKALMKSLK